MTLKDIMGIVRRMFLCSNKDERRPSEVGLPMDVRHLGVGDSIPRLSKNTLQIIRSKFSKDAMRHLPLQSHPPTAPPSPLLSFPAFPLSTPTSQRYSQPSSDLRSRKSSTTLLNAASSNLPGTIPTPPLHKH
ncbi:hypothetical protein K504DRAFT_502960 [Pleomassaria siparia CBS 279.74]|uniref:Uncharacterized protein n=1 Tax=Pleomassaria siparia CBS 279.74 TaxID=1314801 RepID=A0A6G1K7U4_9PLEO|nr:hypothetical protein K504DRAFT_502960 [Pleomassaria siparia CBS 279.74]